MKKFWILGLATLLVIPFTTGCSISSEYKTLHKELVAFTTDSTYAEFFNGNIIFSSGLQSEKQNPTSPYYTITYYETIIKMSLDNLKNFSSPFESVPKYNTNSTKSLCSNVINNINAFKNQVTDFNIKKDHVDTEYPFSPSAGEQTFNDFKTDLGKLAESANNLQLSFVNALTTLYYPVESSTGDTSASRVECAVLQTFSTLLDDYFNYAIKEYKYEHPASTSQIYYSLGTLSSKLSQQPTSIRTINFDDWLDEYKLFKNEHNMFRTALNNVDLTQNNTNLTGASKSYYNKVMHYVDYHNTTNSNAQLFVNTTITLLYT